MTPAGDGSLVFAKSGSLVDRSLVNPNTKDFAPRFGLSYSINSNTLLHAGYGIYYTSLERIGSEDQLALNPPNLINKTIANNITSVLQPEVGFPTNFLDPFTIDFSNLQAFHIRAENPSAPSPKVQQWSLGIQRRQQEPRHHRRQ